MQPNCPQYTQRAPFRQVATGLKGSRGGPLLEIKQTRRPRCRLPDTIDIGATPWIPDTRGRGRVPHGTIQAA